MAWISVIFLSGSTQVLPALSPARRYLDLENLGLSVLGLAMTLEQKQACTVAVVYSLLPWELTPEASAVRAGSRLRHAS